MNKQEKRLKKLKKKCTIKYIPATNKYYPMFNGDYLKYETSFKTYRSESMIELAVSGTSKQECMTVFEIFLQQKHNVDVIIAAAYP